MFLLIGVWGGENRIHAAYKFFLYTFIGSVLMLVAFLYIGSVVGSFNIEEWNSSIELVMVNNLGVTIWWALFIGFAIKIPMFPVHTWLPSAHVEAPATASMLLAGVLLKMGGYAMIRFHLLTFPKMSEDFFYIVAILSVVAIVYASLLAWTQTDMKKLVAYSSIAHMGYVTLGIYSQTKVGIIGAMVQMISHGVISVGLFFMVDILYRRTQSRDLSIYGGVAAVLPKFAVLSFMLILGLMGVPMTSGFVGEIMVTAGVFKVSPMVAIFAASGVVLAPIYGLTLYRKVFLGSVSDKVLKIAKVSARELFVLGGLVALMVWIGIYPRVITVPLDKTVNLMVEGAVK